MEQLDNGISRLGRSRKCGPGDSALKASADFVAATNNVAAALKLAAPTQQEVSQLVAQLNVVNKAIQADQRFAAALKIGKAVAGALSTNLKK